MTQNASRLTETILGE